MFSGRQVTYETFTPELVRQTEFRVEYGVGSRGRDKETRMEKMKENFLKVVAYLRVSGQFMFN